MLSITIIIVIVLALTFDFINGFHDTANSIATAIGTKVLTPGQALLMAGILNFVGAMLNTAVAKTIGKGIISDSVSTPELVVYALLAAIAWNLITWYFGIPSSSSHALIGGLMGAAITSSHFSLSVVNWTGLFNKVILPLLISPVIGFTFGFLLMFLLTWVFHKSTHKKVNSIFKRLQICSSAFMSYSHGSNDAQKSMGVITMALLAGGVLKEFNIPWEVKLACAVAMALGTLSGGRKIIKTMGVNMIKLEPINGFTADMSSALTIHTATVLGAPVSTTHIVTTSIMGVGACKRISAVRWSLAKSIVMAWIFTIPCSATIAGLITFAVQLIK